MVLTSTDTSRSIAAISRRTTGATVETGSDVRIT